MDWLQKGKLPFCFENIAYALEEEMKAVQKQDSLGLMEDFHFFENAFYRSPVPLWNHCQDNPQSSRVSNISKSVLLDPNQHLRPS